MAQGGTWGAVRQGAVLRQRATQRSVESEERRRSAARAAAAAQTCDGRDPWTVRSRSYSLLFGTEELAGPSAAAGWVTS